MMQLKKAICRRFQMQPLEGSNANFQKTSDPTRLQKMRDGNLLQNQKN